MLVTDSHDNKYRCYTRLVVIYFLYLKASLISATYNDEKALFLQPEKKRQTAQHTGHTTHLDQPIGTSCIVGNAAFQYFGKPCSHHVNQKFGLHLDGGCGGHVEYLRDRFVHAVLWP